MLGMVTCRDMDALREAKLDTGEGPMISLILHLSLGMVPADVPEQVRQGPVSLALLGMMLQGLKVQ